MSCLKRDFLPEELIPQLQLNQMQGSIAVQADQSEQETMFLLGLADQYSEIKGVVGWVDLCAPERSERLGYFSQFEKLVGFRHIVQSEPDDRFLLRESFCRGIGDLSGFNFTYDLLIYPKQLPAALELVEKFPQQRFVIDHLAKPPISTGLMAEWAQQMRTIASNPNVYCKLSGLVTEADWQLWRDIDFKPYLDITLDAFGADRLMFGSDWPVCLLAGSYCQVKELIATHISHLSVVEQQKIFGLNAISFYRLTGPDHELRTAG